MMAVCNLCGSLDFLEIFQEESRQLSWLSDDIAVLYKENSTLVNNLKNLNLELENLEEKSEFYEETFKDDLCEDGAAVDAQDMWRICQQELNSLERDIWLQKEVHLREGLVQQLLTLSQDLSTLQHQNRYPVHQQQPHLPRHLWGHQTFHWRPPSLASTTTTRKTKQQGRLLRWLVKRMPRNLIDLHS